MAFQLTQNDDGSFDIAGAAPTPAAPAPAGAVDTAAWRKQVDQKWMGWWLTAALLSAVIILFCTAALSQGGTSSGPNPAMGFGIGLLFSAMVALPILGFGWSSIRNQRAQIGAVEHVQGQVAIGLIDEPQAAAMLEDWRRQHVAEVYMRGQNWMNLIHTMQLGQQGRTLRNIERKL